MDRLQRLTRFSQNGYFGDFCHVLADGLLFGRRDCLAIINRNGSQNGQVHSRRKSLKSLILQHCEKFKYLKNYHCQKKTVLHFGVRLFLSLSLCTLD